MVIPPCYARHERARCAVLGDENMSQNWEDIQRFDAQDTDAGKLGGHPALGTTRTGGLFVFIFKLLGVQGMKTPCSWRNDFD